MRRIAILLWLAVFGASGAEAQFPLEAVFSAPFPTSLTASADGSRVAWVFDERGARNVWAADAPGFEGRRLTSFEGDGGTTIHSLAFSRDGGPPSPSSAATAPTGRVNCRTRRAIRREWSRRSGSSKGRHPAASPRQPPRPSSLPMGTRSCSSAGAGSGRWGSKRMRKPSSLSTAGGLSGTCASPRTAADWRSSPPEGRTPSSGSTTSARRPSTISTRRWTATARPPSPPTGAKWHSCARRRCSSGTCSFRAGRSPLEHPGGFRRQRTGRPAGRCSARRPGKGSVFSGTASADQLHWTDDGRILFPWERTGYRHYYAVSAAGGEPEALTAGSFEIEYAVSDGQGGLIAATNQDDIDRRHLWRLTAGSAAEALTSGTGVETLPVAVEGGVAFLGGDGRRPLQPMIQTGGEARALAPDAFPADFPLEHGWWIRNRWSSRPRTG